jgi:hypothetical protein
MPGITGKRPEARPTRADISSLVRRMQLRRRRSRVPWIYIVYHARPRHEAGGSPDDPAIVRQGRSAQRRDTAEL